MVLVLIGSLSACGFQLRGAYQVPPQLQQVSLDAPTRSDLAERLETVFNRYNIEVVPRADDVTHIQLQRDNLDRRTLSLLATGQVAEYELIYTVPVNVITADGRTESHRIQIFRDYQEDPNFALAKTRELELLVDEMRDDAVNRLMILLTRITWE